METKLFALATYFCCLFDRKATGCVSTDFIMKKNMLLKWTDSIRVLKEQK